MQSTEIAVIQVSVVRSVYFDHGVKNVFQEHFVQPEWLVFSIDLKLS